MTVRTLVSHKVNGLNEALDIFVLDEPGQGNACHDYSIRNNQEPVVGMVDTPPVPVNQMCRVKFQNGPVLEFGVNGVSNEGLLAIVEDRLLGFQSGQFACRENAIALTKIQEAMMWLQKRTLDRMRRGVEGINQQ